MACTTTTATTTFPGTLYLFTLPNPSPAKCKTQTPESPLRTSTTTIPTMSSIMIRIPAKSLTRVFSTTKSLSRPLSATAAAAVEETRTQKLERIADELLDLTKLERYDYAVLFRHKMGFHRYGPAVSGSMVSGPAATGSAGPGAVAAAAEEKTAFDIKLEKFDSAAKIKIIKEVRSFTDLGLKEAKDLVEKAPVVVKQGVSKEEANAIVEKLKAVGATALLE